MKKTKLALLAVFLFSLSSFGQGARNIRINEVMTNNTASVVDGYGVHDSWVELSNIAYSSYNVRGMYITTNRKALDQSLTVAERIKLMSLIPSGDALTEMKARTHVLFYFDCNPNHGTQYLSAKICKSEPTWVALFDGNAITLIDSVSVPVLGENHSYAREIDGSDKWVVKGPDSVTPGTSNSKQGKDKVAYLKKQDPHGYGIAILSMGIVFSCLALLYVFFRVLGLFMSHKKQIKKAKGIQPIRVAVKTGEKLAETGHKTKVILKDGLQTGGIDKEVYIAVISMALKQYLDDVHDIEPNIITIKPHKTLWNAHLEDSTGI